MRQAIARRMAESKGPIPQFYLTAEVDMGGAMQIVNQMLEAEADRLCHAEKYQRNEARQDTRAGFYQRKLHTQAGEVTLNVPKLRQKTFEKL